MLTIPPEIMDILQAFAPVFSVRVWDWVQVLVFGSILAPGRRMVTSVLRIMGRGQDRQFQNYHRVLNRARWSSLAVSRILLLLLVAAFVVPGGVVTLGADETLERRRGAHIPGLGCFRDAARSTGRHKVKSMGLRWVSLMLLVKVPWSDRVWALPFMTVLAPGAVSDTAAGKRHKTSLQWIGQMVAQVRRWLPDAPIVLVVDGGLASLKLARTCQIARITYVTRLKLNARLFDLPPERRPGTRGRKRVVGARQPLLSECLVDPATDWQTHSVPWYGGQRHAIHLISGVALWYSCGQPPILGRWLLLKDPTGQLKPCVLFATDPDLLATDVIGPFIQRWSVEVTFEEVRAHLGFETQRSWSVFAVQRSSPAILGLFSLVTLLAYRLTQGTTPTVRSDAWSAKTDATFADVLARVRRYLWQHLYFPTSRPTPASVNIPPQLIQLWLDTLCYAA